MAALVFAPTFDIESTDSISISSHPVYGARPVLRGRLHQLGALASLPAGILLVLDDASAAGRPAAAVYAITCFLLFLTSASYHRLAQSVKARFWMRRLDHSMIFVHMAGATTPLALISVGGRAGLALLITAWALAAAGATLKLTQLTAHNDPCPWLYPILGTLPLVTLPALASSHGLHAAALLAASAAIYAAGGICFARKHPDPIPTVFGYHEIFHLCTLLAGLCQFSLVAQLVG